MTITWTKVSEAVLHVANGELDKAIRNPKKNSPQVVSTCTMHLCSIFGKIESQGNSAQGDDIHQA